MAAAAKFCNFSHGHGVKNLDRDFLTNKLTPNRIQQVVHHTCATGGPMATRQQLKYSVKAQHRRWGCRAENVEGYHVVELDVHGHTKEEKEENISRAALIWRAIKLPIYTVALIPITVGCAAAYLQTGEYFANRYIILLVSSFCAVAWVNLSNDVYDFDTGADRNKKESVVNLSGSRTGIHIVSWLVLLLGFLGLVWVATDARNLLSVILSGCGVICGFLYQFPQFRLGYKRLGEPLVFAAFGPFATTVSYLLQSGTRELSISGTIVSLSVLVGLTSSLILFCSHFHQIEDDKAAGKFSPLVRLGTEAGAKVVKVAIMVLYSLVLVLGLRESLPFLSVVLCALTLPIGGLVINFVEKNHNDKEKIFMAKYYCVRLHTAFGVALAAGLVGARMFARKQLPHAIIL